MCNVYRRVVAILALVVLAACSPRLDWRELSAADGMVRVAFPAKAHSQTRPLDVGGEELPFTLTAATVGRAVFAVGYMDLPPTAQDETTRQRYIQALEDSLAQNLAAERIERRSVEIRHVRGGDAPAAPGHELELHGTPNEQPAWMLARILLLGDRLIEVAAVGPEADLEREAAQTFVESLRVQ